MTKTKPTTHPNDEDYLADLKTSEKFFSYLCLDGSVTWMWRTTGKRWCITNKNKGSIAVHDVDDTIIALKEFIETCEQANSRR